MLGQRPSITASGEQLQAIPSFRRAWHSQMPCRKTRRLYRLKGLTLISLGRLCLKNKRDRLVKKHCFQSQSYFFGKLPSKNKDCKASTSLKPIIFLKSGILVMGCGKPCTDLDFHNWA